MPVCCVVSGIPTSPSDDCEKYEIHINADVSLAIRQYLYSTGEVTPESRELARQLARYWSSRLTYDAQRKRNVIKGKIAQPATEVFSGIYINNITDANCE